MTYIKRNHDLEVAQVGDWLALKGRDGKPMTDEGRCRVCFLTRDENGNNDMLLIRREDGQPNHEGKVYITVLRDQVDPRDGHVYVNSWGGMSNYMLANRSLEDV